MPSLDGLEELVFKGEVIFKCSFQASSMSITWEHVRNVNSLAPNQTSGVRNSGDRAQESVLFFSLWQNIHDINILFWPFV